jgi:hypothetical protein
MILEGSEASKEVAMSTRAGSNPWHILSFIAVGCLLGALTTIATVISRSAPASASCVNHHANVEGVDTLNGVYASHYGNTAEIYVNTSATINSLNGPIFRSLFVTDGQTGDDVEVGWTANNGGHADPTVYAEWINNGKDSGPQYDTADSPLGNNAYDQFSVFNVGHIGVFRFKFKTNNPFNYSPTMTFNLGPVLTNSEHYNSCDSMWTDMASLQYFSTAGNWNYYYDFECKVDSSVNDWLFNRISNMEMKVDETSGITC